MSTNTDDETETAIEYVAAAQATMNKNLKLLAKELGLSSRDLDTGASPREQQTEAEKAALFGATKAAAKKAEGRASAEVAADLLEQNAKNLALVAETAGVSSRKIAGPSTPSSVDAQKAAFFEGEHDSAGDDAEKDLIVPGEDRDDRTDSERWGEFMHPDVSRELGDSYAEVYRDPERDADPAAGDRSSN